MIRMALELPDGEIIKLSLDLQRVLVHRWKDRPLPNELRRSDRIFVWACLERKWPPPSKMTVLLDRSDVLHHFPKRKDA